MNDEKTSLKEWLGMVEKLRYAPQWVSEEPVPVEMMQTHISVVLLGRERVLPAYGMRRRLRKATLRRI